MKLDRKKGTTFRWQRGSPGRLKPTTITIVGGSGDGADAQ